MIPVAICFLKMSKATFKIVIKSFVAALHKSSLEFAMSPHLQPFHIFSHLSLCFYHWYVNNEKWSYLLFVNTNRKTKSDAKLSWAPRPVRTSWQSQRHLGKVTNDAPTFPERSRRGNFCAVKYLQTEKRKKKHKTIRCYGQVTVFWLLPY